MPDDYTANTGTTGSVAVGDTATGNIGSNGDSDWFAVELEAGRTYVIDLRGSPTDDGTLSDPYLRGVYDADGNLIARTTNDDGGQGYNSRVTFTATESGTHYIAAGAAGIFSGRGTYEVEVTDTSPPIVAPDTDPEDPPDTQEQVQQQPPAFGSQFYGFELPENTDGSADRISLGTVSATDPEGDTLTYSIEDGNAAGLFEIDAASGELFYTGGGEDYETGSTSFDLTVRASDGDQTTDATATVSVTDVDEPVEVDPPVAEPDPARAAAEDLGDITELAAARFPRGALDGGADGVGWYRFTLSEAREVALGLRRQDADADLVLEDAEGHELHSSERSGTTNEWMRETLLAGTYYVRVEAQEAGANAYVFRYGVGDADPAEVARLEAERLSAQEQEQEQVQQRPPAFGSQFYGFELPEDTDGSANRISLGTVSATDPDGGSVTYSIEDGNAAGLFEIDAASGELFYTGGGEDYETGSTSFELTVRASDGDQTTDTTATVSVTDVDEPVEVDPPVAEPDPARAAAEDLGDITELAAARFPLGTLDGGADGVGWYRFTLSEARAVGLGLRHQNADADLVLEDAAGNELHSSANDGTANEWVRETLLAGTYYVRVEAQEAGANAYVFRYGVGDADPAEVARLEAERASAQEQQETALDADAPVVAPPVVESETAPASIPGNVSEPDGRDLPADPTTTGRIAVGGSVTGMIDTIVTVHHKGASETDWYAVEFVAGTTYRIDLKGSTTGHGTLADPYLYGVFDSDGNPISDTDNDDSRSPARNSRVEFTPEEDGTYYIAAGAYAGNARNTGTYTLTVIVPDDDYSAGTDTEGTVVVGGTATGEIEVTGDQDWFAVTLEAGTTYRVVIDESAGDDGTLYEPTLVGIYDSNGVEIPSKTISSSSFSIWSEYVEITPETAGAYYIAVDGHQRYIGNFTGKYIVSVEAPDDDYSTDTDTEGTVVVGGTATGEIEVTGDQDWFAVDLVAETSYRVQLLGQNGFGSVFDTYLAGVYDSDGILIRGTAEINRGIGNHVPLMFNPRETGTYYIAAADANWRGVGTYTVEVEEAM